MMIHTTFYFCLILTITVAFLHTKQSDLDPIANNDLEEYCSLMAVNKLLETYQLPVVGQEVGDHARYRAERERTLNTNNGLLGMLMGNALTKLPINEGALGTLGILSGQSRLENLEENREHLQLEINKLINDITSLQEQCIEKVRSESNSLKADDIGYGTPQNTMENLLVLGDSASTDTDFDENLSKRNNLALNPSGWKRRRRSMQSDRDRVQHFLRNMRQLLNKRQQRLNFNPTGW